MSMKNKEWNVKAQWGNIAMVSWGKPSKPPILMVHGYMDTAATFIPLVKRLTDDYYYVGFDIPGHGKSDPFPSSLVASQIHVVEAMRVIVEHMMWKRFVIMGHSSGGVISLFYHNIFPGKVKKFILMDPRIPLEKYYYASHNQPHVYQHAYRNYYNNFERWTSEKPRLYSYATAVSSVVRNRKLTEERAVIVLSRSLVTMGIDTYKLSWDSRMKKISIVPIPEETLYAIMTKNMPPTLCIDASETKQDTTANKFAENLLIKCNETLPHFHRVPVIGSHDVHITHPELLVPHIETLLGTVSEKRSDSVKCKL